MSNPQTETVTLTERTCRYCRRPYRVPKGERRHACPACAPTFQDAIDNAENERNLPAPVEPLDDGIPF